MSYEKVKEYFRQAGLEERVEVRRQIGDTVEHAAEAIGCLPRQIAKTMSVCDKRRRIRLSGYFSAAFRRRIHRGRQRQQYGAPFRGGA